MLEADHSAGSGARSPFDVPADGWLAVLKRTWAETGQDNIGLIAAGIAFYAFAAIVPLLGAVVLSYGLFADPESVRQHIESVFATLPQEAAALISDQLVNVVQTSKGKQGFGLLVALAIAIYGATKGASAIVTALNIAYDEEEETRGFIRLNLLYFGIVIGGVILVLLAMAAMTLLGYLEGLIPGAPAAVLILLRIVGYLALGALVITAAAALYRFGPARSQPSWAWLSPGSLGASLLWLLGTIGFGIYVANFGSYGATYGSLSAVIVMLTWLWLSSFVFLLGAELNAELERQVEGRGRDAEESRSGPTARSTPSSAPARRRSSALR
jgi:YihY family inner membrane protein